MRASQPHDPAGTICPECGHRNASWRTTCAECGTHLVRPEDESPPGPPPRRPALLTAWAVLFTFYVLLSGTLLAWDLVSQRSFTPEDGIILIINIAAMLIALVIIAGVWRLKAWARRPAIVMHVLMIALFVGGQIYALLNYGTGSTTAGPVPGQAALQNNAAVDICSGLVWLVMLGAAIYWLVTRREVFEGGKSGNDHVRIKAR